MVGLEHSREDGVSVLQPVSSAPSVVPMDAWTAAVVFLVFVVFVVASYLAGTLDRQDVVGLVVFTRFFVFLAFMVVIFVIAFLVICGRFPVDGRDGQLQVAPAGRQRLLAFSRREVGATVAIPVGARLAVFQLYALPPPLSVKPVGRVQAAYTLRLARRSRVVVTLSTRFHGHSASQARTIRIPTPQFNGRLICTENETQPASRL